MTSIMVQRHVAPIDWRGVPLKYVGKASAVCRTFTECQELVKWFGDADFMPYLPVMVDAPGGWAAITGWGYASAAELQDNAVYLWLSRTEKMARQSMIMDFDALREKNGLMPKEKVKAEMSDALQRRIAQHKANPVTDPFRQPRYPRVNGKTVHPVAKIEEAS